MTSDRPRAWNSTLPARSAGIGRSPFRTPLTEDGMVKWPARSRGAGFRPSVVDVTGRGVVVLRKPQRRRETGFPASVKLAVRKRAGGGNPHDAECEACGCWLGRHEGEVQHRAARGSGGCADEVINGIANAVLLCGSGALRTGCHGAAEDRKAHMGMDAGGFWIKHGTTPEYDPRNVPILLHSTGGSGLTVWLLADGTYGYSAPGGDVA